MQWYIVGGRHCTENGRHEYQGYVETEAGVEVQKQKWFMVAF